MALSHKQMALSLVLGSASVGEQIKLLGEIDQQDRLCAFRRAKVAFQKSVPTSIASAHNDSGIRVGWRLAGVMEMLKSPLADNDLDVSWNRIETETGKANWLSVECTLSHSDGHSESCTHTLFDCQTLFHDLRPSQIEVAAITLLKRITLEAVCGLATGETDAELNNSTYSQSSVAKTAQPATSKPPPEPIKPAKTFNQAQLDLVKVFWKNSLPENDVERTRPELRQLFYSWVCNILHLDEGAMTEDGHWTEDRMTAALEWIEEFNSDEQEKTPPPE